MKLIHTLQRRSKFNGSKQWVNVLSGSHTYISEMKDNYELAFPQYNYRIKTRIVWHGSKSK